MVDTEPRNRVLGRELSPPTALEIAELRVLADVLPGCVLILDRSGTVVGVRGPTARVLGYSEVELLGRSALMLVPERSRTGTAALWGVYAARPDRRDFGANEFVTVLRKDGSESPASITLAPIPDVPDTRILAFIRRTSLPDEGSQETTTASSENNYQALFEATEEALLVVGRDGRYLDANSAMCELTEYTRTELRTMQVGDLAGLPPQRHRDVLKRMSGGERWRLDLEIPRKNGGHVPVEVVGEPVNLPAGSAYRFAAREISERRAREQLQRDLLAMVSHELRNPLAGLLEWARMIESGRTDPGKAIPIIARQAAELERLIGELVDTVRISSDHVHLDRSWFDLRDLVQESVQDYEMLAPEQVELESPATPVRGHWDRVRLGQVLRNLLSNAIKYSPQGGKVRVKVKANSEAAQLSVADEGLGISQELLARIFDRFYRAHDAEEREALGLGLGLFIARALVESHGGRIWAASEGHGKGSTFTVSLPLTSPADNQPHL